MSEARTKEQRACTHEVGQTYGIGCPYCEITRLLEENRDLTLELEGVQYALAFWLPKVPADDAMARSEIGNRIANDAYLLAGLDKDPGKCAEERGWITLGRIGNG